ncbi:MAG: hypothetical protein NXH95_10900 [Pseudomonadaceae bacterium]|nr:hypothetical protein [Pseudomonadaceae bacterium]
MPESEIWQIIQSGNEISVMRTEVFITITVGVLLISTINAIKLTWPLLLILLVTYLVFGYVNFTMLVGEMEILVAGITQLHDMGSDNIELSYMGRYLASQAETPIVGVLIPALHLAHWTVTIATSAYAIWRYRITQNGPVSTASPDA